MTVHAPTHHGLAAGSLTAVFRTNIAFQKPLDHLSSFDVELKPSLAAPPYVPPIPFPSSLHRIEPVLLVGLGHVLLVGFVEVPRQNHVPVLPHGLKTGLL